MIKILERTEYPITHMGKMAGICWGSDISSDTANLIRGKECIEAEGGIKYDQNKLKFGLIPAEAEAMVAAVLTIGAIKYAPGNWKKSGTLKQDTMMPVGDT